MHLKKLVGIAALSLTLAACGDGSGLKVGEDTLNEQQKTLEAFTQAWKGTDSGKTAADNGQCFYLAQEQQFRNVVCGPYWNDSTGQSMWDELKVEVGGQEGKKRLYPQGSSPSDALSTRKTLLKDGKPFAAGLRLVNAQGEDAPLDAQATPKNTEEMPAGKVIVSTTRPAAAPLWSAGNGSDEPTGSATETASSNDLPDARGREDTSPAFPMKSTLIAPSASVYATHAWASPTLTEGSTTYTAPQGSTILTLEMGGTFRAKDNQPSSKEPQTPFTVSVKAGGQSIEVPRDDIMRNRDSSSMSSDGFEEKEMKAVSVVVPGDGKDAVLELASADKTQGFKLADGQRVDPNFAPSWYDDYKAGALPYGEKFREVSGYPKDIVEGGIKGKMELSLESFSPPSYSSKKRNNEPWRTAWTEELGWAPDGNYWLVVPLFNVDGEIRWDKLFQSHYKPQSTTWNMTLTLPDGTALQPTTTPVVAGKDPVAAYFSVPHSGSLEGMKLSGNGQATFGLGENPVYPDSPVKQPITADVPFPETTLQFVESS